LLEMAVVMDEKLDEDGGLVGLGGGGCLYDGEVD